MAAALAEMEGRALDALMEATAICGALNRTCDTFTMDNAMRTSSKTALEIDMAIVQQTMATWRSIDPRHVMLIPLARQILQLQRRLDAENDASEGSTRRFWTAHATSREQLRKVMHAVYFYAAR